ncbi:hypothetical protein BJ912DRAFT_1019131 [Pholiota molesta]|nr:hypothetical protein BJ912DRAFT_1019131 [Pholiota molesta]
MSPSDINISLETHLIRALKPIYPHLPAQIAQTLEPYVGDSPPALIPGGPQSPQVKRMDPHSYSMISLLAGSTTSPDRKFGAYVPPKDPEEIEADRIRERKTITVLLNALLSIGCVGFTAWWAADKTGWKAEWRALFALFAASLWPSRSRTLHDLDVAAIHIPNIPAKTRSARHKKMDPAPVTDHVANDDPQVITDSANEALTSATLRQRRS